MIADNIIKYIKPLSKTGFSFQKMCVYKIEKNGFEIFEEFPVSTIRGSSDENVKLNAQFSAADILARQVIKGKVSLYLLVECKTEKEDDRDSAYKYFFIGDTEQSSGYKVDFFKVEDGDGSSSGGDLLIRKKVSPKMAHICPNDRTYTVSNFTRLKPNDNTREGSIKEEDNGGLMFKACKQVSIAESFLFWNTFDYAQTIVGEGKEKVGKTASIFLPIIITNSELNYVFVDKSKIDFNKEYINYDAWGYQKVDKLVYEFPLPPILQRSFLEHVHPRLTKDVKKMDILVINQTQIEPIISKLTIWLKENYLKILE